MPTHGSGDSALRFDERGTGPLVLLLHGSPGSARAWSGVTQRLASRYRVVAPDLPGHGGSPGGDATAERHLADTRARIGALIDEIGPPAVVAGHSYGGVVALSSAIAGLTRDAALALLEPVVLGVLEPGGEPDLLRGARGALDDYVDRFERGEADAIGIMVDLWLGDGAFGRMPQEMRASLAASAPSNVVDVRATSRETFALEALRRLEVPVSVAVGSLSPPVTQAIARILAEVVPAGALGAIEGAGHGLIGSHADEVAALIADLAARRTRR